MNKIAFVFSGQGAQKAGMGKDFMSIVKSQRTYLTLLPRNWN